MGRTKPLSRLAAAAVLISSCGSGAVPSGSETTSPAATPATSTVVQPAVNEGDRIWTDEDAAAEGHGCVLNLVMWDTNGAITGTLESIESDLVSRFPWDADYDRTYALVRVLVDDVAADTLSYSATSGGPMPELVVGEAADFVLYQDTQYSLVEPTRALADEQGQAIFVLFGMGDVENPEAEGVWGVSTVASVRDGTVVFEGVCGDQLTRTFGALAARLGRPADVDLFMDYQAEELARYGTDDPPGPIAEALTHLDDE